MSLSENLRSVAGELGSAADDLRGLGFGALADRIEEAALDVAAEADDAQADEAGELIAAPRPLCSPRRVMFPGSPVPGGACIPLDDPEEV